MRRLQEALVGRFDRSSWHIEDLAVHRDERAQAAVDCQLAAFRDLYGEPTHIDGHHHIHVHPAVLACLPRELPIRTLLTAPPRLGDPPSARVRLLRQRFVAPDGCIDFRHVMASLPGGTGVLDFARDHVLEVMVHPQQPPEREALHTPAWAAALAEVELGSYRDVVASRSKSVRAGRR
jgi:predicted glycoside hydrolase/deacetylase ChbG (UPF0249 family)